MVQIGEEIESFRCHPLNRGYLRRSLALRISTHRIRRLAREYFPSAGPFAPK